MENILLTVVIVLLFLVLIMMIGMVFLALKIWKEKKTGISSVATVNSDNSLTRFHPEVRKRMEEAQELRKKAQIEATCHLHPKEPSEGACAICSHYYCLSCLKSHGTLWFCKEHLNLFLGSEWKEAHTVKSTPDTPEAGVEIVEFKNNLWETESLPLYVETHYKINVEGDLIESWIVLYSRAFENEEVKKRLNLISSSPATST